MGKSLEVIGVSPLPTMNFQVDQCFRRLVNTLSQGFMWNKRPPFGEEAKIWMNFYDELKKYIHIPDLTLSEALVLGFGKWDDDSDLYLFPLYLIPLIPTGLIVTAISGEKFVFDHSADLDVRFGCVAYGLVFQNEKPVISYGR